jgi:hypothetical protein
MDTYMIQERQIEKELKKKWRISCYDHTGKPLDNWMSFEEWKMRSEGEQLGNEWSGKTVSGSHYTAMCKYEGGDCQCTSICLFE